MSDRPEQGNLADPDATTRVLSMALGLATVQLVRIAAQFGIADALQDGPRSADEIAAACGMFGATAARVFRALVGIGIPALTVEVSGTTESVIQARSPRNCIEERISLIPGD